MGFINIPKKKSHNKEWVPYKDGVELKLDYPTSEQEIKIEQKKFASQVKTRESMTIEEQMSDETSLDFMGYSLRCWIKGWRTVLNGEVKDGVIADEIDMQSGDKVEKLITFKSDNNGLMAYEIYAPLAKEPLLIWDMWAFCKKELEFTDTDKKKLNSTQESTEKADIKV